MERRNIFLEYGEKKIFSMERKYFFMEYGEKTQFPGVWREKIFF